MIICVLRWPGTVLRWPGTVLRWPGTVAGYGATVCFVVGYRYPVPETLGAPRGSSPATDQLLQAAAGVLSVPVYQLVLSCLHLFDAPALWTLSNSHKTWC